MKKLIVGVGVACFCAMAWAFDPDFSAIEDSTLIDRYPSGSIVSRDQADLALTEVRRAKSRLNELAKYSTGRCQENFFVNSCIDDVRKARMRQEKRLMSIESEARAVIRKDKAQEEQRKQAERDRKAAAGPSKLFKSDRQKEKASSSAADTQAHDRRMQQLQKRQTEHDARAQQEAENRANYELRQLEHEKRVRERRAAVEKRRAKKDQQQQGQ